MADQYAIKTMTEADVQIAINWARELGWNPGLSDAHCFYEADPHGFFMGVLNGEVIATGAAVAYDEHYAFCGLYVVKSEFRGKGYGMQLTRERLKYVGDRITGLDGVLDKVSKYERIGYVAAHTNKRFVLAKTPNFSLHPQVVQLKVSNLQQIEELDRRYFPAKRTRFLKSWIGQPNSYTLGFIENQKLRGYGVIRKCCTGYKIGPLFAETAAIAQALFESIGSHIPGETLILDTPVINPDAQALVKQYNMTSPFEVIRMYRNGKPNIDINGIYGITSFELG